MSATLLYRIAAILLILFAAGHTIGFLTFRPPTPESLAVRDAMNQVRFEVNGSRFSYGGFYLGFGLFVSAYLLFAAFAAWRLGALVRGCPRDAGQLGWALCAVQLVSLALSWIYFSAAPALFSAAIAVCIGAAAWRGRQSSAR